MILQENVLMFPRLKEKIKKGFGITFMSKMKIKTFFIDEVTLSRGTRKEFQESGIPESWLTE